MASWIKMRTDLADDPAVIAIANATGLSEDAVVGKLHRLWSWADRHTTDGICPGLNRQWVDKFISQDGFADAMQSSGWLRATKSQIEFPEFEVHNSKSAKHRAEISRRVNRHRAAKTCNANVTQKRYRKITIPRPIVKLVMQRDDYTCLYCGRKKGEALPNEPKSDGNMGVDHVIPECRGGDTTPSNLVTCCNVCNRFKNNRTPDECNLKWPEDVTGLRYGSVTKALPREDKSKNKETKAKKAQTTFTKPTAEEVETYCQLRQNGISGQDFVDSYDRVGWVVGRNHTPMKDWKAAVHTWERERKKSSPAAGSRLLTADEKRRVTLETLQTGQLADA